jgi:hypothetical protein
MFLHLVDVGFTLRKGCKEKLLLAMSGLDDEEMQFPEPSGFLTAPRWA